MPTKATLTSENERVARQANRREQALNSWPALVRCAKPILRAAAVRNNANPALDFLYIHEAPKDSPRKFMTLQYGQHPVGARTDEKGLEVETGCALVITQDVDGAVLILLTPFHSESRKYDHDLLIRDFLRSPEDGTDRTKIRSWISDLKVLAHATSVLGAPTARQRARLVVLRQIHGTKRRGALNTLLRLAAIALPLLGLIGDATGLFSDASQSPP